MVVKEICVSYYWGKLKQNNSELLIRKTSQTIKASGTWSRHSSSNHIEFREKIAIVKGDEIIYKDDKVAKTLNNLS